MYSWQHCGTGTLSYRQPRHLVIMDPWNGQQRAVAIKMFYMFGLFKSFRFFVSPCTSRVIYETAWNVAHAISAVFEVLTLCIFKGVQEESTLTRCFVRNVVYYIIHIRQDVNLNTAATI
jgi:hypothetical protein